MDFKELIGKHILLKFGQQEIINGVGEEIRFNENLDEIEILKVSSQGNIKYKKYNNWPEWIEPKYIKIIEVL